MPSSNHESLICDRQHITYAKQHQTVDSPHHVEGGIIIDCVPMDISGNVFTCPFAKLINYKVGVPLPDVSNDFAIPVCTSRLRYLQSSKYSPRSSTPCPFRLFSD